ncbi:CDCA3 protein, partial [Amazona guildingii]|nr:CDCA3 protein [Amazona guildingii]
LGHPRLPRRPPTRSLPSLQVVSSPGCSPPPGPAELAASTTQDRDPRSPTPGIFRTPMRAVSSDSVDCLVKQLSEVFRSKAESREPAPPAAAYPAEEPARRSPPEVAIPSGEAAERPPSPSAVPARPARAAGAGFFSGKCSVWGNIGTAPGVLRVGSKPIRYKTNNKILATSGGTGRSPLSILQDDNSPSAPAPRQGKRHMLGESLGEKKEVMVDLSRSLKSGNCAWSDLNKENQQCPFVEN